MQKDPLMVEGLEIFNLSEKIDTVELAYYIGIVGPEPGRTELASGG